MNPSTMTRIEAITASAMVPDREMDAALDRIAVGDYFKGSSTTAVSRDGYVMARPVARRVVISRALRRCHDEGIRVSRTLIGAVVDMLVAVGDAQAVGTTRVVLTMGETDMPYATDSQRIAPVGVSLGIVDAIAVVLLMSFGVSQMSTLQVLFAVGATVAVNVAAFAWIMRVSHDVPYPMIPITKMTQLAHLIGDERLPEITAPLRVPAGAIAR